MFFFFYSKNAELKGLFILYIFWFNATCSVLPVTFGNVLIILTKQICEASYQKVPHGQGHGKRTLLSFPLSFLVFPPFPILAQFFILAQLFANFCLSMLAMPLLIKKELKKGT